VLVRRSSPALLGALAAATVAAGVAAGTLSSQAADGPVTAAAPRWADIQAVDGGYRFRSGGHDNRLTIRLTQRGLRLADRSVEELTSYPSSCEEVAVSRGIAAVCAVPDDATAEDPLELEVQSRLGDDLVDASSLPASVELSVLADAGADRVRTGAADDFVNGARGRDRVRGGDGDDWIRTGLGRDRLVGGAGHDRLVGVGAGDWLDGGSGDDEVGGGPGNDVLHGGPGRDTVRCSTGRDEAFVDAEDVHSDCEVVAVERA